MTLDDLLVDLAQRGIKLGVEGGRLRVRGPKGALTPDLRQQVTSRKEQIIALLDQRATAQSASGAAPKAISREKPLALSFAQQRLWFLVQMDPGSPVYNLPNVGELSGPLDVDKLRASINAMAHRHEILRTSFQLVDGQPAQVIAEDVDIDLPVIDLRTRNADERLAAAQELARQDAERPFDLALAPLIRTTLIQLDDDRYWFLLTLHHIVSDGWSWTVILRELKARYEEGERAELPDLPIQFADYADWEQQQIDTPALQQELAYWKERLGGELPVLELPTDRPRPRVVTYRGECHAVEVPKKLTNRLRDVGKQQGATLFMTVMAAFQTLLYRYSGQRDVSVGTPIARRNQPEVENLIGCFINSLVVRSDLGANPTFNALLDQVRKTCADAYGRQDVPFEKLVEELQPERDLSHSPLFQAMLILHVQDKRRISSFGDVAYRPLQVHARASKFDVTLELQETETGLVGWFEYSSDLFEPETIARMETHLLTLLEAIATSPDTPVGELALMPDAERRQLTVDLNNTSEDYPRDHCTYQLIEQQAESAPDRVAVRCGDESLTYRELNQRANRLARHLRELGVTADTLVAISMSRSYDLLAALLAVSKAGGAYLPLDPSHPKERLRHILDDSSASILVTDNEPPAFAQDMTVVSLSTDAAALEAHDDGDLEATSGPTNLAYVIYTSGSTGKPKGVMVEHRSLVNFLHGMSRRPGFAAEDSLLAVTTIAFDIAGLELYLPLICGGQVYIATSAQCADGRQLAETIESIGPSVMQATPATWQMLLDAGWRGDKALRALCGGEALPRSLANQLTDVVGEVWNLYGPTETTIWSAVTRIESASGSVSIGEPIANTQIYVLDDLGQPAATGVPGELHIGGDGLARGYLNRPELTAERFVSAQIPDVDSTRLYRTGDLVRHRASGGIAFIGRTDHQVKVRGFRIELGEIESVLEQLDDVEQAIVIAREFGPGDKRLVAFLLQGAGQRFSARTARKHLRKHLPDYMVPSVLVPVDTYPLTPNGKVDRISLAKMAMPDAATQAVYEPPQTTMEQLVANIWKEVLGAERVGLHDNFFDLGGHSLLSMKVLVQIENEIGHFVNPKEIFTQTLQQFSAVCERLTSQAADSTAA